MSLRIVVIKTSKAKLGPLPEQLNSWINSLTQVFQYEAVSERSGRLIAQFPLNAEDYRFMIFHFPYPYPSGALLLNRIS